MKFNASSILMSKKTKEKWVLMKTDDYSILDQEIGLKNLPKCIGGSNSVPLEKFQNNFDKYFENSFIKGNLELV